MLMRRTHGGGVDARARLVFKMYGGVSGAASASERERDRIGRIGDGERADGVERGPCQKCRRSLLSGGGRRGCGVEDRFVNEAGGSCIGGGRRGCGVADVP